MTARCPACEDRARYYHPTLQRFISEDPIGFAGGDTNLYAYVWNSPTGLVDPLGLDAWSDAGNLAAGFGDTISLGGTTWVRSLWIRQFGLPDTVDQSSGWNLAGRKAGQTFNAISAAVGGFGALRAAPAAAAASGRGLAAASRAAFQAADDIASFRVPLKHLPGAGGNWAKFAEGVDPHGAIAQALRSAGARFLPNTETSFKVITDLGTAVGSKGQTGVRVIVDFTGRIISAFPVHP